MLRPDQAKELLIGPPREGSVFASDAERRQIWEDNRVELMMDCRRLYPGQKPWAWHRYDPGEQKRRDREERRKAKRLASGGRWIE